MDQNGYAYGNNNPVMNVDPDGHWVWLVVNAGFAAYDGYKAYKSGKGWKGAAWAAASNFGPGKIFKGAKRVYKAAKTYKLSRKSVRARKGAYSRYSNSSGKKAITRNRTTNIGARTFEKNLRRQGWRKSIVRKGNELKGISMHKNGRRYFIRRHSKEGSPTADYYPYGAKRAKLKIRLRR